MRRPMRVPTKHRPLRITAFSSVLAAAVRRPLPASASSISALALVDDDDASRGIRVSNAFRTRPFASRGSCPILFSFQFRQAACSTSVRRSVESRSVRQDIVVCLIALCGARLSWRQPGGRSCAPAICPQSDDVQTSPGCRCMRFVDHPRRVRNITVHCNLQDAATECAVISAINDAP